MQKRRLQGARGEVTSTVVMVPAALILVLVVIQAAMAFHAKSVVTAAAQDYVRAVQTEQPGSGDAAAQAALAGSTSLFTSPPTVSPQSSGGVIAVDIQATVVSVVPGWSPVVSASASGPAEQFRAPGQSGSGQ